MSHKYTTVKLNIRIHIMFVFFCLADLTVITIALPVTIAACVLVMVLVRTFFVQYKYIRQRISVLYLVISLC